MNAFLYFNSPDCMFPGKIQGESDHTSLQNHEWRTQHLQQGLSHDRGDLAWWSEAQTFKRKK